MGNGSSQVLDFWAHLATTKEVRSAARSIEAWQKAQEANRGGGGPAVQQHTSGPLLYRLGGADVVRKIVEGFYRRLYANERLLVFLHDKDMISLRAKQSAFMSWLFGPPGQSYSGKSLRVAHLRLIKQRGFSPEDFETGLGCFADAMREEGAPEALINETINKIRPFKDIIFTPGARDAEEEARWIAEEREREVAMQARQQQLASDAAAVFIAAGSGAGRVSAGGGSGPGTKPAGNGDSRPASAAKVPQCPFTGGRLSRPGSGRVVPVSGDGAPEKAKSGDMPAPSTPPLSAQPQSSGIVLVETLPLRPSSGAPRPVSVRAGSPAAAVVFAAAAGAATAGDVVVVGVVEGISAVTASPPLAPPGSPPLPGSRAASRPASSYMAVSAPLPVALPPPPPPAPAARPQSGQSTSIAAAAAGNRPPSAAAVAAASTTALAVAAVGGGEATATAAAAASPATDGAAEVPPAPPARAGTDIVAAFLSEVYADEPGPGAGAGPGADDSKAMVEAALAELGDIGPAGPAAPAEPAPARAGGSPSPSPGTRLSTPQPGAGGKSPPASSSSPTAAAAAATPRTATPLSAGGLGLGAGSVSAGGGRPPSQQATKVC